MTYSTNTASCSACGAIPPPGAGLMYVNGWPYCPRCFPCQTDAFGNVCPTCGGLGKVRVLDFDATTVDPYSLTDCATCKEQP